MHDDNGGMSDTPGELGALLQSWRRRRSPADVGLPAGGPRRTGGLRREELAALASLSVDYVVRLEQGRARHPSDQVASALARALQLDDAERDHLYRLAGLLPPMDTTVPTHVPPGVQRLVARLGEVPVAVFTASWDLLTWSPLWAALLGDPSTMPPGERNVVKLAFAREMVTFSADVRVRQLGGPGHFRRSLVADLRRVQGRYPGDPRLRALIDDLLATRPEFAELWRTGAVGEHQSARKTLDHPLVGAIELDCDVFDVAGADLRIVAYTAATGTPEAEKLDFLRVTGSSLAPLSAGSASALPPASPAGTSDAQPAHRPPRPHRRAG